MEWFRPDTVRASLADEGVEPLEDPAAAQLAALADAIAAALVGPNTLAIALGANLPSPAGEPAATLLAVRPLLERLLESWAPGHCHCHWSPLLCTRPVGGPPDQPEYVNAVLVAKLPAAAAASQNRALVLLAALQQLEQRFGRPAQAARQHWGPRSLDLDLLWWGGLDLALPATSSGPALTLPHPRWRERAFVLEPLAAVAGLSAQGLSTTARHPQT